MCVCVCIIKLIEYIGLSPLSCSLAWGTGSQAGALDPDGEKNNAMSSIKNGANSSFVHGQNILETAFAQENSQPLNT